jgi:hypothetical protein
MRQHATLVSLVTMRADYTPPKVERCPPPSCSTRRQRPPVAELTHHAVVAAVPSTDVFTKERSEDA